MGDSSEEELYQTDLKSKYHSLRSKLDNNQVSSNMIDPSTEASNTASLNLLTSQAKRSKMSSLQKLSLNHLLS